METGGARQRAADGAALGKVNRMGRRPNMVAKRGHGLAERRGTNEREGHATLVRAADKTPWRVHGCRRRLSMNINKRLKQSFAPGRIFNPQAAIPGAF